MFRLQGSSSSGGSTMVEPEDELTIPRAAMNKMIKEILPNIRVANEVAGSNPPPRPPAGLGRLL
jgi:hypothetical protein